MAHWHGLAKLRMHTDLTLEILDHNTILLGKLLRDFQLKTSTAFNTKELQREANARGRRKTKAKTKDVPSLPTVIPIPQATSVEQPATASGSECLPGIQHHSDVMNFHLLFILDANPGPPPSTGKKTPKPPKKPSGLFPLYSKTLSTLNNCYHNSFKEKRKRTSSKENSQGTWDNSEASKNNEP